VLTVADWATVAVAVDDDVLWLAVMRDAIILLSTSPFSSSDDSTGASPRNGTARKTIQ